MRKELDRILTKLASEDLSLVIVVSDLGSFREFRSSFPNRFFNVGVAEQNAVGIAAGLASEGKRVILFGVAGFTLYRGFEQIKFSIGYWNQSVCIVGTGFGWNFYQIGRGHHVPDDIALMRLIPNVRIFAPVSSRSLPDLLARSKGGPTYLRLGLGLDSSTNPLDIQDGRELRVIALGEMAQRVVSAVVALRERGIDAGISGIESLDVREIRGSIGTLDKETKVFVVEDHISLGGLGSLVAEAGYEIHGHRFLPLNVEKVALSENDLLKHYGFGQDELLAGFMDCLAGKKY